MTTASSRLRALRRRAVPNLRDSLEMEYIMLLHGHDTVNTELLHPRGFSTSGRTPTTTDIALLSHAIRRKDGTT